MMRWVLVILTWLVAVAVLGPVIFFAVMIFAGPHSSILPAAIQPAVLVIGWVVFLAGPVLIARSVWHRTGDADRLNRARS